MQPTQAKDFTPDEAVLAVALELSKGSWKIALHDGKRDKPAIHLEQARAVGIDTGTSTGLAIILAITGSSVRAARVSAALFERGINVQPILYPAVPEKSARLRFFISCQHTEAQIKRTTQAVAEEFERF